ncbi:MAG: HAD-IIB family hydrolase [Bacteriovoracaceae bacterium]
MKIVFSDFDGTLTVNGKLGAVFFDLLELIEKNHSELVIVSGRSLSWGHFLLTHFPLKRAIMEGGGVILSKNVEGIISEEFLVSGSDLEKLERTTIGLQDEVPETALSVDSFGRKTDRAIEFSQMRPEFVEKAESFLLKRKANFSRSNVHVNFWHGDISKSRAVDYFLKRHAPHVKKEETIFYGDSLNDESLFETFPNTVGVSNIISVLDQLHHRPKVILEGKENAGTNGVLAHLKEVFDQSVDF